MLGLLGPLLISRPHGREMVVAAAAVEFVVVVVVVIVVVVVVVIQNQTQTKYQLSPSPSSSEVVDEAEHSTKMINGVAVALVIVTVLVVGALRVATDAW